MLKTVSEEVKQYRLSICQSCEELRDSTKTCKKCNCYMPAKTTFAIAVCPLSKWEKSEPGDSLINKIEETILDIWNKQ